jgi:hypothetical protein
MGRNTLRPIAVELTDTRGKKTVLDFRAKEELDWFLHNEGDHIVEVKFI